MNNCASKPKKVVKEGGNIDFSRFKSAKEVSDKIEDDKLTQEQIKTSRQIIKQYCNEGDRQVLKTIQGSGKSKAVPVAIKYLLEETNRTNFVYFSNIHDNKLSETYQDLTEDGRIIDPFTGEKVKVTEKAEVVYLKGLEKHMEDRREDLNLTEGEPLGIFKTEDGDDTILKKLYKDMNWPLNLALGFAPPPDYHEIIKDWVEKSRKASQLAESGDPLVVVAPKELRHKSLFRDHDWKQFYDEIDYADTNVTSIKFDEGRINQWLNGDTALDLDNQKLEEAVEEIGELSNKIWQELTEYSLNQKSEKEIKNISADERVARWKDSGNLYVSRKINLFTGTFTRTRDRGIDPYETKQALEKVKRKINMGSWGRDSNLLTDKVEKLVDEEKYEKANKLLQVQNRIKALEELLNHGAFLSEKHTYKSEKVGAGKTPFKPNNREVECHLWTISNGIDDVFRDMFISDDEVSILSASLIEDWLRLKADRFEKNFSHRHNKLEYDNPDLNDIVKKPLSYDLPENLFTEVDIVEEGMEVNITLHPIARLHKKTRTPPTDPDEIKGYENFFRPRIKDNGNRAAISPLRMDIGDLSWNSNAEGSNKAEGVDELFVFFTYTPPTEEFLKVYADMRGDLPPLEYRSDNESKSYKEYNIPKDLVSTNSSGERTGFDDPELNVVHKCLVNKHINDAIYRAREHYKEKDVYLLGLETEHIRKDFKGNVAKKKRLDDLAAKLIAEDEGEGLSNLIGEETKYLVKWVESKGYDFDGINSGVLTSKILDYDDSPITSRNGEIVERLTDEERVYRRAPKDEWLTWQEEFMDVLEEGKPKSTDKIRSILPDEEGTYDFGEGTVEVETVTKKSGAVPRKFRKYKFLDD